MRLRPGCGCLLLILGLFNAIVVVAGIVAVVGHNISSGQAIIVFALCGSNMLVDFMVAFAALRRSTIGTGGGPGRRDKAEDDITYAEGEEQVD